MLNLNSLKEPMKMEVYLLSNCKLIKLTKKDKLIKKVIEKALADTLCIKLTLKATIICQQLYKIKTLIKKLINLKLSILKTNGITVQSSQLLSMI